MPIASSGKFAQKDVVAEVGTMLKKAETRYKISPKGAAAVKFHRKRRGADRARRSRVARCLKTRLRFEANLSRIFTERSMFRIATFYARIVFIARREI